MCKLVLEKHYSFELVKAEKVLTNQTFVNGLGFIINTVKSVLLMKKISIMIDFKIRVLKSIAENNMSLRKACVEFNIPTESIIIKWKKIFLTLDLKDYDQNK
jgi:transposase